MDDSKVSILLVDDQPSKLLSHQAILRDLNERLLCAGSAREALELLLKNEVAVVLIDVCMPETDGFELAAMIRDHPRFKSTAIIFISAILLTDVDRLHGYEMGAVDYVPVPVIPEVLRAKVKVFLELYRKTRQLEQLNRELEARVAERTSELAASTLQLRQSEQLRSLALAAGQMGCWEWNANTGAGLWDQGQYEIFGVDPKSFVPTLTTVRPLVHPDDLGALRRAFKQFVGGSKTFQAEFRVRRPDGEIRWCVGVAAASFDEQQQLIRLSGVTVDITARKQAEDRLMVLAEEVDHRARNVIAVVQSILRLTRAQNIEDYITAINGRIRALSIAHKLLAGSRWDGADLGRLVAEEVAPYQAGGVERIAISGPVLMLPPATAQSIALALHELVTNAAKYGALSSDAGRVGISWQLQEGRLELQWVETGGPTVRPPSCGGYGMRVVKAGIEGQLGGVVEFVWRPEGLICKLTVSHDDGTQSAGRGSPERQSERVDRPSVSAPPLSGNLALIVEDEPMVSMMLTDMLAAFGHAIDGPYSRLSDAMSAAAHNQLHVGILDINVGGEKTYALADLLTNRKIPFVFVTGYSADRIDPRFIHVPVLQKPIEPQKLRDVLMSSFDTRKVAAQ
jgi:PAS domain S-box-containing protein